MSKYKGIRRSGFLSSSLLILCFFSFGSLFGQTEMTENVRVVNIAEGWANNSVNAVIFRKNSLVSYRDTQFVAFYDQDKKVVLGKRKAGDSVWILRKTSFFGNTNDAHNAISIMVDGEGYLHLSWDHHNNPLRYAKSIAPGSLEISGKLSMTGTEEKSVSYPEFYKLPDGDLLFFYRNGESGKGNLVINRYDLKTKAWTRVHSNLISGEGIRNAYWQAFMDHKGTVHVSWVWRETPDVASNHDLAYACSKDGGKTWQKTSGEKYVLPITQATAEYACKIPQKSELINQTSMSADKKGRPYIATYWRDKDSGRPQYHIVYRDRKGWKTKALPFRKSTFSLSGIGTKRIPISRPQIMMKSSRSRPQGLLIFRDEERGNRVSAVKIKNLRRNKWHLLDLTNSPVGSWEPTFDTELWKSERKLNLFLQNVVQIDGEGTAAIPAQMVQILEWKSN